MNTVFIYSLVDPRNGRIKYVGKSKHPIQRLQEHIAEAKKLKDHTFKNNWIRKLLKQNLKPETEIIDEIPEMEYEFWESFYIKLFKSLGESLVNADDTGLGNSNIKQLIKHNCEKEKAVIQYDLNGMVIKEYKSMRQAEKHTGIDHGAISRVCYGEYNHTQGFVFRFKHSNIIQEFPIKKENHDSKPIFEIDKFGRVLNEYTSIMDASRKTGIDNGNISRVCNNKKKFINGRFFKFKH